MDSRQLANIIAAEALETKAKDLKILDLRNLVSYTDYFILATGTSDRHLQAIADRVNLKLKHSHHRLPLSLEGYRAGQWVLLDYGGAVLHVFLPEHRVFYGLDELWADAPLVSGAASSTRVDGGRPKVLRKSPRKKISKGKSKTKRKGPAKKRK